MVLELHHLRLSQSDRIVWMLEEMQLPYELIIYDREIQTGLAPQSLKKLTPAETAPFLRDTSASPPVALFESGAIIQYLLEVYGPQAKGTKLGRKPGDPDYADYVQFFHFASTTVASTVGRCFTLSVSGQKEAPMYERVKQRLDTQRQIMEDQLSKSKYLAGDGLTIADIIAVFPFTTMRGFFPMDLSAYPNILRYLKDVTSRPAYVEAARKGDNGMQPMIEANTRRFTQFEAFKSFLEAQ